MDKTSQQPRNMECIYEPTQNNSLDPNQEQQMEQMLHTRNTAQVQKHNSNFTPQSNHIPL